METFLPDENYVQLYQRAAEDIEVWYRARGDNIKAIWKKCGGGMLDEFKRDREATIRFLQSSDTRLRLAAASLLAEYWVPDARIAPHVLRVAFNDPEPAVRGAALFALLMNKQHIADPTGILRQLLSELFPAPPKELADKVSEEIRDGRIEVDRSIKEMWEQLAGAHAGKMLESRKSAMSYLSHADPRLRRAALFAFNYYHNVMSDKEFEKHCEAMIAGDANREVRSTALTCLACRYFGTDDTRVGRLVAEHVRDEANGSDVRSSAYLLLLALRGMPGKSLIDAASPDFRFPEDIDWSFVDSFLCR